MVVDSEGYIHLIQYLTENLSVFENSQGKSIGQTIAEVVEVQLTESIMALCQQHTPMDADQRFAIVRETDAVLADLEEVLSGCWERQATQGQAEFIDEFIGLMKNLFDSLMH